MIGLFDSTKHRSQLGSILQVTLPTVCNVDDKCLVNSLTSQLFDRICSISVLDSWDSLQTCLGFGDLGFIFKSAEQYIL